MAEQSDAAYKLMAPQALLLLLFLPLLVHFARRSGSKHIKRPLPSPPGLPLIGHLHHPRDHVSLSNLAKKHGRDGLMLLRLGAIPYLVVTAPRAAKAVMRTHDHLFASRPPSTVAEVLLYGPLDIVFTPYGEHWRHVRKLATTHLFTVKKVQSFRFARRQEVRLVISKIREAATASTVLDLNEMLNTFANDVVCRALSGKFFRAEGRNKMFRELIVANSSLFDGFNLENCYPRLAKIGLLRRFNNVCEKARKVNGRWDDLLQTVIEEHEQRSARDDGIDGEGEVDFIDIMLSVQQEYGITKDHIKAMLMDMFAAGTDTTSSILEVAMAELMCHPQAMARLQAEVRNGASSGEEMVEEDNLTGMAYLKAVVKETLRLHPPLPLLLPHISMADCNIGGYTIPSGTRVIVNAWAINRDTDSWERPEEFLPERFLDGGSAAAMDLRGNDFEFLPFGAGRRACPAINFGLASVDIMLANLVHCFDWELPPGTEKDGINMTEVFRLSLRRKEILKLVPKNHLLV